MRYLHSVHLCGSLSRRESSSPSKSLPATHTTADYLQFRDQRLHQVIMAKGSQQSNSSNVTQKHIHSRLSFLYQASNLLSLQFRSIDCTNGQTPLQSEDANSTLRKGDREHIPESITGRGEIHATAKTHPAENLSRLLLSQMRAVSQKSQVQLLLDMKRTICRRCDSLLTVEGASCTRVENNSAGGKKTHADVLVIECLVCRAVKRFPIGSKRQAKRRQRHST